MFRKKYLIGFLLIAASVGVSLLMWEGGEDGSLEKDDWEPIEEGMILTRNFRSPGLLERSSYYILDQKYKLGSKAYARDNPKWVRQLDFTLEGEREWNVADFPVAYADEFDFDDGSRQLIVIHICQAFSGDGYYRPGPELYLVCSSFEWINGGYRIKSQRSFNIGSQQYCRILAGVRDQRTILFKSQMGEKFGKVVTGEEDYILTIRRDQVIEFKSLGYKAW